jgi:tripartite-type tricarboxylate transporter receptor subunit TctC
MPESGSGGAAAEAQPFAVENRIGAGGNVGTEFVAHAPPDGYTLLEVGTNNFLNASLYKDLNFNFIRDISAVGSVMLTPGVMEVNPSLPVRSVPEFVAYAKANPGKLNMASAGIGTNPHVFGELFKTLTGVEMVHVPYRGGPPALNDLIGGRVQVMFDNLPSSIAFIREGKLRALAVTTARRLDVLPELPTIGEFVPGYSAVAVNGLGVPSGTPSQIVAQLNIELNAGLANSDIRAKLSEMGGIILPGSPADFEKQFVEETEKWAKVIKEADIRPE